LPYSLWSREAIQELIKQKYGIKAKKEHGIILFGDETGICNQENYQRGFSPAGVAPLPIKNYIKNIHQMKG
jgi:hypothetical protein